ncbi:response regulator [Methylobacillus gramineus]|uniref:response regulator n=1 Tax=Methylobacillus gramineus TaxID=755169 RepID=UPI001CFF60D0|nr:response regulator [Methylobacillus gramineus]MCB5185877.1 response regulator [Methylobacillus gramineus]
MTGQTNIDQASFKRILRRNLLLPIGVGISSAVMFVILVSNLLSSMSWVEHTERVIGKANEIAKLTIDLESGMRGFLISGDEGFLSPYQLGKPKLQAEIATLIELVSDNPVQVDRLKRIMEQEAQWGVYAQSVIELRRQGKDYASAIRSGRGKMEIDEIRKEIGAFVDSEQRLLKTRNENASDNTKFSLTFYLIFVLGLTGFLGYFGRRELLGLSSNYENVLAQQQEHADTLQKQAWLRAGQSSLAELGIGQLALPQLGRTSLDFLGRYVGVLIGAIYIRDDHGTLRRFASYGFSKEQEDKDATLHDHQGLLGQCAAEERIIHLTDVPANYTQINSALGSAIPHHVAIVPLKHDGHLNGVIELGFLKPLQAHDIEFLTLISGNLSIAIEVALSRQRLQDILEETQQLNEELQVQQEELRTSNEELEEQSRVLEESQATLENQKAELEQTNDRLAEQALSLDQKNAALKEVQDQLEDRARDLERASQYKSEFLANMSHELRTPLNSSLILAKLLSDNREGNLNEEQVRFAQTIYSAGNDLLNLINDILDISKVEAGKLELAPEHVAISSLSDSLNSIFSPLAMQKKLGFTVTVASEVPAKLFTDRQRLEQILKNLLANAIKFTDRGHITLNIETNSAGHMTFAVQDSGIGIDASFHNSIFAPFRQVDGTSSRRYGGTGLGLSISRNLATLLGGSISVSSSPGQGSTFTLTLPSDWAPSTLLLQPEDELAPPKSTVAAVTQAPAQHQYQAEPQATTFSGPAFPDDRDQISASERTVLVIEDEVAFSRILYELAHEMQYRCLVAHTAEEGLHLATHYQPQAILLDMRLPDQSGLSVLQQLKESAHTRHIPVHVVSAADHAEAALHLGAIGYALKPATLEELKKVFSRLEEKLTQKIKRVLLVEDDARQRESVHELISDADVEIVAVEFGEQALELLHSTIFDCMIIDLKLPDMQGSELLKRMSTEKICAFPPVIVYTGRNLTREEETELLKYSRSIIIKGARSPERLLDEVTLFLHKVESELSSERQHMLKTIRSRERIFDGRRILLVDDDVRNVFALTSALEQKGMIVEVARNGLEAIAKLDNTPGIDLVLMDVMMPEMDGLEATRRIRSDSRFERLPIIAITAKAMKDDQEQCLKAGMSDYLAKPIDLTRLHSLLRVWMPVDLGYEK